MDIVVDTSAIIAVIANEPEKPALAARTVGATLTAPRSVPWEIGNAFSAMLKRHRITLMQTQQAIRVLEQIPLRLVDVELAQALELSSRLGIYAYDAYIIACALNEESPLLALDGGLRYAAQAAGVEVLEFR